MKEEKARVQKSLFKVEEYQGGARYGCIVADPPWVYTLRVKDKTHRNRLNYTTMSNEDIMALPIAEHANDAGCVLWLWTTNNHMGVATDCLEAWGFTLKSILTWSKISKNGKPRIGVGHWLRNSTEHCLVATINKPSCFSHTRTLGGTPSILEAQRREHSRKPDEFYELVEKLQPDVKRLELFARQRREGWDCIGDELDKFESA